jgi:hypothetical protein
LRRELNILRNYSPVNGSDQGNKSDPYHNKRKIDLTWPGCYGKHVAIYNQFQMEEMTNAKASQIGRRYQYLPAAAEMAGGKPE